MTSPALVTRPTYVIRPDSGEGAERFIAVGVDGAVIAGAYRPRGLNDWRCYVAKSVSDAVALDQPHKSHVCSRVDAFRWVDLIAALYTCMAPR